MGESAEKVGGVVAVTKIPRGARSPYLALDRITLLQEVGGIRDNLQVGIWSDSQIQPLQPSLTPAFWPRWIKLAPDCHAQNVQLSRVSGCQFVLTASKDIPSGAELLLWFDEDLLIDEMGIPPYLSPMNIRGGNSYICTICGVSFQAPNNLKIHLALRCGSLRDSILWGRLASKVSPDKVQLPLPLTLTSSPNPGHNHNSVSPSQFWASGATLHNPGTPPLVPILMNGRNFEASATPRVVHPIVTSSNSTPSTVSVPIKIKGHSGQPHSNSKVTYSQKRSTKSRCGNPAVEKAISVSVSDPEAQLESIVSNMGKARNGHMCLYCGKLYSRKYGLKIHIRTHTGYKPLRCRICHRPFGDPSNLNKHIRLHSDGNTPYRCDICHKVLVRKRDLERHIRSRHTTNHPVVLPISLQDGIDVNGSGS